MNHISIERIQIEFISSIHLNANFSRKIAGAKTERYLAAILLSALRTSAPSCDEACQGHDGPGGGDTEQEDAASSGTLCGGAAAVDLQ